MDAIIVIVIGFLVLCAICAFVVVCCVVLSGNTRTNEDGEFLTEEEIAELDFAPSKGEGIWK